MRCPHCRRELVASARFCHHCGFELPPEVAQKTVPWFYDPVFVLLSIFLVFAVFGLPLLWKSPHFSRRWKIAISVITVLYTAGVLWVFYYFIFYLLLPYYRQLMIVV